MVKVSIIIPVYNVQDYLNQCLDSVCNQTLHDIEIICVNDGSTDNSAKILSKYAKKDSRIRIINKKNAGLGAARNSGLMTATGKYIAFIDSDDWVSLDYYEKLYKAAISTKSDIAVSNMPYWYNKDNMRFDFISQFSFGDGKKELIRTSDKLNMLQSCTCCNKLYRRELITKNNLLFYEGKYIEDFPFTFMVVALSKKIICLPNVYQYYRQQEKSIMHNDAIKTKKFFDALDNFNTLIDDAEHLNIIKDDIATSCLVRFIYYQTLARLENLSDKSKKLEYQKYFINTLKRLPYINADNFNSYDKTAYKLMLNNVLNNIFNIQYETVRVKIKIWQISILKIRKKTNHIVWLLFNVFPVFWKKI
ncbi:MAG: glycosyltransferase [Alphaproteobacteria bacterium]|nr:glycosyltransferase [Alphaproteobacteria bacterium]